MFNSLRRTIAYIYEYVVVNNGHESDKIKKNWKNKVIQSEQFDVKENQRYKVSVLMRRQYH